MKFNDDHLRKGKCQMSIEPITVDGELLIRDAKPEDAAALAKLNREEMGYEYPEEKTRQKLQALLSGGKD